MRVWMWEKREKCGGEGNGERDKRREREIEKERKETEQKSNDFGNALTHD